MGVGFATPPTAGVPVPELPTMDQNDLQLHSLSLRSDQPVNTPVLEYEQWLLGAKREVLQHITGDNLLAKNLSVGLEEAFKDLQLRKVEEWVRQREDVHLREDLRTLCDSFAEPGASIPVKTGAHD